LKLILKKEGNLRHNSLQFSSKINESPNILPKSLKYLSKLYSGKYLLRNEINLSNSHLKQLLLRGYFKTTNTIETTIFNNKICLRCHNEKPSLFATIPCAKCHQIHYYCRKCIHMGRVLQCESLYYWNGPQYQWSKGNNSLTWSGNLTKSQEVASHNMLTKVKNCGELLVWAVTGSGKTEMLFPSLQFALSKGYRICIATPRADVVRELLPRLKRAFKTTTIQGLYSGSRDNDGTAQLLISTTHQLLRYRQAFDLLIIDEIDAFPYHQDLSLPIAAKRSIKKDSTRIYLTATPRKKQLLQMKNGQLDYVFVPIRFHGKQLPAPISQYVPNLSKTLQKNKLPKQMIRWFENRHNQNRQLIIFVPTISMTKKIKVLISNFLFCRNINQNKENVQSVSSVDPLREDKIEQFREKRIFCLITTTILERGVTFPSVDVVVIRAHHDVFDEQALVQIAGRAGRSINDPNGNVIFFHEGETDAIIRAIEMIHMMNKKAEKFK